MCASLIVAQRQHYDEDMAHVALCHAGNSKTSTVSEMAPAERRHNWLHCLWQALEGAKQILDSHVLERVLERAEDVPLTEPPRPRKPAVVEEAVNENTVMQREHAVSISRLERLRGSAALIRHRWKLRKRNLFRKKKMESL